MTFVKIAVICHGNIARSQILKTYLTSLLQKSGLADVSVLSAGTAPSDAYPHAARLLQEVETNLTNRGFPAHLRRTVWSKAVEDDVATSDLILVADEDRKNEVRERMQCRVKDAGRIGDAGRVFTFYEYIGEGSKSFSDTYDPETNRQDPDRFSSAFDELYRIAVAVAQKLSQKTER